MDAAGPRELAGGVWWVGAKDWNRRLFDGLIPLPQGTTYNSYLVRGSGKLALIDTVNPGFEKELESRVAKVAKLSDIDYMVMNHAEPDHAGSIPFVMAQSKKAVLVATEKGAKMAQVYYHVPAERIKTVKEGDTVDLGGKTLRFIDAPWLHWPETMFTYLVEEKILFPCDFFGLHTAFGSRESDVEETIPFAKRYFGEIMMPFRKMGKAAMDKLARLEIRMICPSHGPVHMEPELIMGEYRKWVAGETREKALVAYVSMWGHTDAMVKVMVETLMSEGVEVSLFNLAGADVGDLARELVDSRAIVLGTPTVLGGMHPQAIYAAHLVKALRPPAKYAAVLSSYGWGGGALRMASEMLGPTGLEVVGAVEVNGPASEADMQKVVETGKALARKIKGQA